MVELVDPGNVHLEHSGNELTDALTQIQRRLFRSYHSFLITSLLI
jgi:hypothetical protein